MRGYEITTKLTLVIEECYTCGIVFGMPDSLKTRLLRTHETFYCPAGHGQHYTGPSDVEKLKKQLEAAEQQIGTLTARARHEQDQREAAERNERAAKRELNRTKKRVSNGVCPCCNRTFVNLQRHMAGRHPDYQD